MRFTVVGGRLGPEIADLTIRGHLPVTDGEVRRNVEHAAGLGLASYRQVEPASARLAVVGGGLSINERVEQIRDFDGEIWAINGAWKWCHDRGIAATFFAIDPHPIVAQWAAPGIAKALLETRCDPAAFAQLAALGAAVALVDIGLGGHEIRSGSSAATAVPYLAMRMGYRAVTFYGCESCYLPGLTHAYQTELRPDELVVDCGGEHFLTAPDFYLQARELAHLIRELPEFLAEDSGGLLRALINQPEHSFRWVSEGMARNIEAAMRGDAA